MRTVVEHYTGCQYSMPFVLNDPICFFDVLQYTSDFIVVPCCMNSTIISHFLPQKPVTLSFQADVCLNFFGLFDECVCTVLLRI
jgi:hypothetical protein